jgi:hypothetical protein
MRGPKMMAVAVLACLGSSFLAVHLRYRPDPTAVALAPGAPPLLAKLPAAPAGPSAPPAPPQGEASDLRGQPNLGVFQPLPMPAASTVWERRVKECVWRNARGAGHEPTLPGRSRAPKQGREERRLRLLAMRAACEQEVAR